MDKLTKVRAEVERLHDEYRNKKGALYYRKALRTVLFFIDSMPKEPVSEDLGEAAENYATTDEVLPNGKVMINFQAEKAFKAGANWQKEQMMAKAVDATIAIPYSNGDGGYSQIVDSNKSLPFGEKVKVLVIKEE